MHHHHQYNVFLLDIDGEYKKHLSNVALERVQAIYGIPFIRPVVYPSVLAIHDHSSKGPIGVAVAATIEEIL